MKTYSDLRQEQEEMQVEEEMKMVQGQEEECEEQMS